MKTELKRPRDLLGEIPTKIKSENSSYSLVSRVFCCRSTANGRKSDRWESDRPDGRPWNPNRELYSLTIDRDGRPGKTESTALAPGRPIGRPMCTHAQWCMSVDRPVDRQSSSALPAVDRTRPRVRFLKTFWSLNFSDKNSLDGYIQNKVLGLGKTRVWS